MGIRNHRPTTPGSRGSRVADEILRSELEKSSERTPPETVGSNSADRVTTRHSRPGRKRAHRLIDFRRHNKDGPPGISVRRRKSTWIGIAFAAPFILNLLFLVAYPLLATFYYSFTDFNLFQPPQWIGFENYARMMGDNSLWQSAFNTAVFTFVGIPIYLVLALIGAHILNLKVPLQPLWRAVVYLPSIVPVVVSAYLWKWLFNGEYGFVNEFLGVVGLSAPNWLVDPNWMKPATIIMISWTVGGTTLIYLAAMQQIPTELYEAAALDGAGPWRRFRAITWPMLSPITLFQTIVLLVAQIQIFNQPLLLAQERGFIQNLGGSGNSLLTYTMYLFQNAFTFLDMGYASAMATALFFATLLITGLLLASTRWWVTYEKNG